jgi:hypothetical protein
LKQVYVTPSIHQQFMVSNGPIFLLNQARCWAIFIFFAILLTSCAGDCPVVQDEAALKAYAMARSIQKSEAPQASQVAVYLDYSNGMHGAIDQCYRFFQDVVNMLDRSDATFYRVGLGAPLQIEEDIFEPQSKYNPRNPSHFSEKRSYLKKPLQEIVEQTNRQSVFITDFERVPDPNQLPKVQIYDGKAIRTNIDFSPWATKEFERWLNQGGAIDIFVHPFQEPNQQEQRYLYFLVFTPSALVGKEDPTSIFYRMKEAGYTAGKGSVAWLGFSRGRFKGERGYEPKESGGINRGLAPGLAAYGDSWDYYQMNFADLLYLKEYMTGVESEEMDTAFFSGIEIKGYKSSFGLPAVGLREGVATADYRLFLNSYYMDSLSAHSFSSLPEADGIFSLSVKEGKVALSLDADYLGMETSCELYQLEIWLEDAPLEMDEGKMQRYLQWTDRRGADDLRVASLYESMREAMRRQTFTPQRIHTLYFELIN